MCLIFKYKKKTFLKMLTFLCWFFLKDLCLISLVYVNPIPTGVSSSQNSKFHTRKPLGFTPVTCQSIYKGIESLPQTPNVIFQPNVVDLRYSNYEFC